MEKIFKKLINPTNNPILVELPKGSVPISVSEQQNFMIFHYRFNPEITEVDTYEFLTIQTGKEIHQNLDDYTFLWTVLLNDGNRVFHVFYKIL